MSFGNSQAAQAPIFPDIPDRDQFEQFPWEEARVDTVPAMMQPGDVVLPIEVAKHNPALVAAIRHVIMQSGEDPDIHVAGSPHGRYNPVTGQQHHFVKSALKSIGSGITSAVKSIAPVAAPVVGFALGGPAGAALASGAVTKATGGSWGDALTSGALTYAGGSLMQGLGGGSTVLDKLGTPSTGFGSGVFNTLKSGALTGINALPQGLSSSLFNASFGGIGGALLGSSAGGMLNAYNAARNAPMAFPGQGVPWQGHPMYPQLPGQSMWGFLPFNHGGPMPWAGGQMPWAGGQGFPTPSAVGGTNSPMPSAGGPSAGVRYLTQAADRYTGMPRTIESDTFGSNLFTTDRRSGFGNGIVYV